VKRLLPLLFVLAALLPGAAHSSEVDNDEAFVIPEGLEAPVAFWKTIYATYTSRQVVMHDNRYLNIAYEVLDFTYLDNGKRSDDDLDRLVDDGIEAEKQRIIANLMLLDSYRDGIPYAKLTPEQQRIVDSFADVDEVDKYKAAADRVRGQRGQREKFLQGIADVAPYMPKMEQAFRSRGLPSDLSRLTFVESMFNLHAYSKVGAAGPWQFLAGTGKLYMTITPEVDERMDPIRASEAAARLLQENYDALGNWGLALTAYNHGVGGMKRAISEVGSDDIGQIVWTYQSRSFGFASRNFYAEFLAARDVYDHRQKYFGKALDLYPSKTVPAYQEIVLPDFVPVSTLESYCDLTESEIKELNPALTHYVFEGEKYLPKQYPLKVPLEKAPKVVKAYALIPRELRFAAQKPNEFHVVKRGETLVAIARKYNMSVDSLMDLNALGGHSRLMAGQKLRVLASDKKAMLVAKSDVKEPKVKVLPPVKLAEDVDPSLPVPELNEDAQQVLAAASAPAVDVGPLPPSLVEPGAIPSTTPAPMPTPGPGQLSLKVVAIATLSNPAKPAATPAPAATPMLVAKADPPAAAASIATIPIFGRPGFFPFALTTVASDPPAPPKAAVPETAIASAAPTDLAATAPGAALEPLASATAPVTITYAPSPVEALHDWPSPHDDLGPETASATYPGGVRCHLAHD
jgi:membrane-bound lytic murein transglycosylase D